MSSLEPMEKQLKTITTALAELDTRSKEISDQGVIIEASIHDTTRQHCMIFLMLRRQSSSTRNITLLRGSSKTLQSKGKRLKSSR